MCQIRWETERLEAGDDDGCGGEVTKYVEDERKEARQAG